jgi:hypothetical protein
MESTLFLLAGETSGPVAAPDDADEGSVTWCMMNGLKRRPSIREYSAAIQLPLKR